MTVRKILDKKGYIVITIDENATVRKAISEFAIHHVGSLVVVNGTGEPVGTITERDIVRVIADDLEAASNPVRDAMTRHMEYCSLDDTEGEVMERMTKANVRHLAVRHFGKLVGVVSVRDILKLRKDELEKFIEDVGRQAR